ncbi:MAG: hypothetical protein RBT63_07195, partial [Bdellovibrionales bacterium]|nr:hypothetical protein [Bdellovibrionales bacterium]
MRPLPSLSSYTDSQLEEVSALWPAAARYRSLLLKKPTSAVEALKLKRHEEWLKCAAALFHKSDLDNAVTDQEICYSWSQAADHNLKEAARISGLDQCEIAVFALG